MLDTLPRELKRELCLFLDNRSRMHLSTMLKDWRAVVIEEDAIWEKELQPITQYRNPDFTKKEILQRLQHLFQQNAHRDDLLRAAKKNLELTRMIILTPRLRQKLRKEDYRTPILSHPEIVSFMLRSPRWSAKIDRSGLIQIASTQSENAKFILSTPRYMDRLMKKNDPDCNTHELLCIAKSNPEVALQVCKIPGLLNRLSENQFLDLIKIHADVALVVLQCPRFIKLASDKKLKEIEELYINHFDIIELVINLPKLRPINIDTAEDKFAQIVTKHSITLPSEEPLISHWRLVDLAIAQVEAAKTLLQIPEFIAKCTGYHLRKIAVSNPDIAIIILENPKCLMKLNALNLHAMAKSHPRIKEFIQNSPDCMETIGMAPPDMPAHKRPRLG